MNIMKNKFWLPLAGLILISCSTVDGNKTHTEEISGKIENGYRVLSVQENSEKADFVVYRGDYIKFIWTNNDTAVFNVPDLGIEKVFENKNTFVKMKKSGLYPFTYGTTSGNIKVLEYIQQRYKEISSAEAIELIKTSSPIILDVRTGREYSSSHIKDAIPIPVQSLKARINEIEEYANSPVLVYCASGNRSTVASKMLIDAGFNNVNNLRYGIREWIQQKNPVVSSR